MDRLKEITDLILTCLRLIVDYPQEVAIECRQLESGVSLRIAVAPADIGKIIGKQGRTARALRVLTSAMAMTANLHISLDIQQ
jgi:hypothetical protein